MDRGAPGGTEVAAEGQRDEGHRWTQVVLHRPEQKCYKNTINIGEGLMTSLPQPQMSLLERGASCHLFKCLPAARRVRAEQSQRSVFAPNADQYRPQTAQPSTQRYGHSPAKEESVHRWTLASNFAQIKQAWRRAVCQRLLFE